MSHTIYVQDIPIGEGHPLALICGTCVIENEEISLEIAGQLKEITSRLQMPFIFKASYDKANRTNIGGYRGPGLEEGLAVLERVKTELSIPVTSDVHTVEEAERAGRVLDLVQIPACLFKQIDLVLAAGKTGKPVNIKKGQFAAPWEVKNLLDQLEKEGCDQVMVTERGTLFGYQTMVNDFRSIPILKSYNRPLVYDASHSMQALPDIADKMDGARNYVPTLARAAVAAGVDVLFLEAHPDPDAALSDPIVSFDLGKLEPLLRDLQAIAGVVRG